MLKPTLSLLCIALLTACNTSTTPTSNSPAKQALDDVLITTLPAPAGWQIKKTSGLYCRFFQHIGNDDYANQFNNAMTAIREEAKKQGAQAMVNLHVTSATAEIQGSKWQAAVVNLCGDLVTLE